MGYESTTKNFRLYDEESKKGFVSCDVSFNESTVQDQNVQYWVESDEDEGSDKDEIATGAEDSNATNSTQADSSANESNVIKSRNKDSKASQNKCSGFGLCIASCD